MDRREVGGGQRDVGAGAAQDTLHLPVGCFDSVVSDGANND